MRSLARWWRTLRFVRPGQAAHRLRLTVRRRLWERSAPRVDAAYRERAARLGPARFTDPGLAAVAAYRLGAGAAAERARIAGAAVVGRFEFLGRPLELGRDVVWHRPDLDSGTRLWKTQLHELPFAIDLAATARDAGDSACRERLFALAASWDAASPIGRRGFAIDCWNARAVATRLANLAVAGSILGLAPGAAESEPLGALLARHALFLRDNLELDLRANHLLRDAVGLVFARTLFGGFDDALPLLRGQIEEQVLADGAHVERTPLYHVVVLQDLLEARLLLGADAPAWLRDAVLRMAGFLAGLLHGDGDLPLFADTWLGEVDPQRVLAAVRALPEAAAGLPVPREPERASGLLAIERAPAKAVLRAGAHGPDWQLGHAHGDLLSFELSRGTERIVTDTGTLTYDAGPARDALRSTAAHNTVELDGLSQIEAWGSFRVGRRGRARTVARGEAGTWTYVWASHDAYAWLPGRPVHHRVVALAEDALLVLDAVTGSERHRIASALHLVPDADRCTGVAALRGDVVRSAAPWHPRWGETLAAVRLRVTAETELPWFGGWLLRLGEPAPATPEVIVERHPPGLRVHLREAGRLGLAIEWTVGRGDADRLAVQPLPLGG